MAQDKNLIDKLKDKAKATAEGLKQQYGLGADGAAWPQTKYDPSFLGLYPNYKTTGFLPPTLLSPQPLDQEKKFNQYTYKDWRGHLLSYPTDVIEKENWYGHLLSVNSSDVGTKEKFEESVEIPKNSDQLSDYPYSTRDSYLIFDDNSVDYFRHGLNTIDRLTPIENPESGASNLRLSNFTSTPFENNDPVMYGFDIIIDDISSPLLNGSISDFIRNYSNVSEIAARGQVYEEFKQQFIKFFKTKATVRIDDSVTSITKMRDGGSYADADNNKNIFQSGKKSYLNYYLKKIDGLDKLVEQNTPEVKKFLTEYNKDTIKLSFSEDTSLSLGTLAHLYKLLYWSKPNGKSIVPENLLRFNCDIVVSEVRNFNRVRKAGETGDLEVIKDNVSRHIYSLRECQFYFNGMPHDASIDMGNISSYNEGGYTLTFDYKYVTSKLERFTPTGDGFGQYVGYNSGAIWKIGNVGERENRGTQSGGNTTDSSVPKFFTVGGNSLNENGIDSPFVLYKPKDNEISRPTSTPATSEVIENSIDLLGPGEELPENAFDKFKKASISSAKKLKGRLEDTLIRSASRELQTFVNTRTAILNKALNKVLDSNGIKTIRPPRNIYTDSALNAGQRIFYDVRGDLINFVGGALGNAVGGGFSGGNFSPR